MKKIIECVPNFSEGRDMGIIKQITDAIESVEGISLLNVDPGKSTNRTVVTFVGEPKKVVEAAFRAVKKASELIDMSKHKGEHPRMGATDVCPLVPISGITMEETAEYSRKLAERVGKELHIPVYMYEDAQPNPSRKNLSEIRNGEYEGFFEKIKHPDWMPDFGEPEMNPKSGATVIGARDFLVAYNINLNTTSTSRANSIAFDVREKGRIKRKWDMIKGEIIKNEQGETQYQAGSLKHVKAIGWFIQEYGIAQISMNLTNIRETPLHIAFDETCKKAEARGIRVTGSELVGLIPLKALLDAGKYFLRKQNRSTGVSQKELIKIAVHSLGLNELHPFEPEKRVIEYLIENKENKKLVELSVSDFADETASESAAPGGGTISAIVGAFGVSLATMVANLSSHKRGWDERWEEFSDWAEKGQKMKDELLKLADEDTIAFNKIMTALAMPKNTDEEKKLRQEAKEAATREAIEIPFRVMKAALGSFEIIKAMVQHGNPNSLTDATVAALCARTAVMGAFLNVKVNLAELNDKKFVEKLLKAGETIEKEAIAIESKIINEVSARLETLLKKE